MHAINASLEAMTREGTLTRLLGAYLYAALLVAGPWIFTVLGLMGLGLQGCEGLCTDFIVFRSVVIYNAMFAFIVSVPMAFFCGRYASEQIHSGNERKVTFVLLVSLCIFQIVSLFVAVPFIFLGTALDGLAKIASIQNLAMIGCSWLLIPFLGAMRANNAVLIGYGVGALCMFGSGAIMNNSTASALLLVFNASLALTNLFLFGTVILRFGNTLVVDWGLKDGISAKWELPVAGFAFAFGLWIDKLIMWYFAPSGAITVARGFQTMPSYDTAVFWSQIASIPILAIFFVHVETNFASMLRRCHERTQNQASLRELKEVCHAIQTYVLASVIRSFTGVAGVALVVMLFSMVFMDQLGLRPPYMSILRVSLCAMAFYTSAIFCVNILLYLDMRRPALVILITYALLNGAFTLFVLPFGSDFYGYGNMFSSAITFLIALSLLLRELPWLIYHLFITNNPAISRKG